MPADFKIHCVTHMEDFTALCGEKGMKPALDLFTRSWQYAMKHNPDDSYCKKCLELWREPAITLQKEHFRLNTVGV